MNIHEFPKEKIYVCHWWCVYKHIQKSDFDYAVVSWKFVHCHFLHDFLDALCNKH